MSDFSTQTSHNQSNYGNANFGATSANNKNASKLFKNSKTFPVILVIGLVVIVAAIAIGNLVGRSSGTASSVMGASTQQASVDAPTAQQVINKTFNFPLNDASGKQVSQLQYQIQNAELRNNIIVKGQRATAVKGRTFLILNLKITNNYDKSVQLNSKDYIRLIVGSSPEKLAADIHNDPVDVQAISTKFTRLGFPINDNEKNLFLQVGEITGKKDTIQLNLK